MVVCAWPCCPPPQHPDTLARLLVDHCLQCQPAPKRLPLLNYVQVQLASAGQQLHSAKNGGAEHLLVLAGGGVDERSKRRKMDASTDTLGNGNASTKATRAVVVMSTLQDISVNCRMKYVDCEGRCDSSDAMT